MENKLISYLETVKKATVSLHDLEQLAGANDTYEDFAAAVFSLLDRGYLHAVKSHDSNWKGLPHTFRIQKGKVKQSLLDSIQKLQFQVHPDIQLRAYYTASEHVWVKDQPWILKISDYLNKYGLPVIEANSSQRSYELVQDEKWIDEKGGRALLEKINLADKLKIVKSPDPLMFSLNPNRFTSNQTVHKHLIVENKATYYGLIDLLPVTGCTSLIYGAGWKIASSLSQLPQQLGLQSDDIQHLVYYFGDLDYEGISIYYFLFEKYQVQLATEFYQTLMDKPYFKGKENQTVNPTAMNHFLQHFKSVEQEKLLNLFQEKGYYPQEALSKDELQNVWRRAKWAQN
ncbi:Wadjet anti-phage system protein JetD domain-containing protein [Alkalihalobacterium chitinilyticum]|uniref:DUF2220 domain-containing protein n=1 Tax=Alkalihalobacterium chitinilyticum TaxID=2980103 RepID=A0ABT5VL81_9BACI|nr:Wadjet anti-phage system protein JetD domain-containing protein [Alkalihalobacterium chitinilyticum]MDE5416057.1 DUF2220 domain-containing protein [Alkalihalobacterium chitinilyticum]